MKVAFFGYEPWEKEYVEAHVPDEVDVTFFDHPLTSEYVPDDTQFDAVSVFVDSSLTADVLETFENLSYIATRSTGFDHIDLGYCKERGISISNVPTYGENTVAEFTFALLLSLSRRVHEGYARLQETGDFNPHGLEGFDLKGKTLGVVGTGSIGRHVVKIAHGFSMHIVAHDPHPSDDLVHTYDVSYKTLDEVLAECDILTLHVPHNDATHHLIDEGQFTQMKDGAYLVNTCRGAVVNTQALVSALHSGKLAGAALDVLEEEGAVSEGLELLVGSKDTHNLYTVLSNYKLIDMPNVIVTPHAAFNSREAKKRILDATIDNFKGFVSGKTVNSVS